MKKKINITIDADLIPKIDREAEKDSRNKSSMINHILKKHFDGKKEKGQH